MPSQIASAASSPLRRVFDRRAADFDRVAFLPREIAGRMMERLDYIKVAPQRILDAGCGTGSDISALATRYPASQMAGLDFSRSMLRRAVRAPTGEKVPTWMPDALRRVLGAKQAWIVQGDYGALPFGDGGFDMVWSNQALQWHAQPDRVFPEWQRVLAVGGLLMFSTMGPDTLLEVRESWLDAARALNRLPTETADTTETAGLTSRTAHPPVLDFVDMHDFGDMLVASGFELPVMDMERLTVTYKEPGALLADVRGWGAYREQIRSAQVAQGTSSETEKISGIRAKPEKVQGLANRVLYRTMLEALASRRQADGTIPLTFEIIYGHAWKAAPRNAGQAVVRVDEIGGRKRDRRS